LEIVTISFFKFSTIASKWWAFKAMGLYSNKIEILPKPKFIKLLGSGGNGGFGLWPNFGIYGLLISWENKAHWEEFKNTSTFWKMYMTKASDHTHLELEPLLAHGYWDEKQPFANTKNKPNGAIAVLTRGKIKRNHLLGFWTKVAPASKSMFQAKGLNMAIGLGELPLIQQATVSIWESVETMQQYAYKSEQHSRVIKLTREKKWYSEELFARFNILSQSENFSAFFEK
jgi:hypothetical protein